KAHILTDPKKATRVDRSSELLSSFALAELSDIDCSDEKIFTVEEAVNLRNHRIIVPNVQASNSSRRIATSKSFLVFVPQNVNVLPCQETKILKQWCKKELSGFMDTSEWPPYLPGLNPLDYSVWDRLESEACTSPHQEILSCLNNAFPKSLWVCIRERRSC
ncbi:unnamed protein product, partial [Caenorhabditis auriculariae]